MKTINKILGTIAIATAIGTGCKTIEEGVIYKTREYVGKLEYARPTENKWNDSKKTFIQTDSVSFFVKGHPEIKSGTLCYIKHDKIHSVSGHTSSIMYLTWDDIDKKDIKKHKVYGRKRDF